ncbi:MAG: type III secretion system inner membrane ring subunit SctD, partial [Parachlamydiaceae bacterium]|nr:type III secretion system inner membrane ring subunit SctD [Parachlamydiaceae bacterium]
MVAKLVVEEGDLKGLSLTLENGDSWIIGRDPDECQLVIEDPLVSRKHFIARETSEGIVIENLSPTNPLYVNDEALMTFPRLLHQGDTIQLGNQVFRFYEDASAHVIPDSNDISDEEFTDEESMPDADVIPTDTIDEDWLKPEVESDEVEETSRELQENEDSAFFSEKQNQPNNEKNTENTFTESMNTEQDETEEPYITHYDTILKEDNEDIGSLAEINFGLSEVGRWLLKVIGGPNNGAEFYMENGSDYLIGTDPHSCDIVFHDTSVSRQHAKISITSEDTIIIEDLKSRNGVIVDGVKIQDKSIVNPNAIITLGTTSFAVYDREGEMHTIISPLLPSILKALQKEESSKSVAEQSLDGSLEDDESSRAYPEEIEENLRQPPRSLGPLILLAFMVGLFVVAGLGTYALFKTEPVVVESQENADELIQQKLKNFPAVRYSYNKANQKLLLIGHVSTPDEKRELLYQAESLKFIKSIDESGIVIDEYQWKEFNSIISKNPQWKGVRIYSPEAGQFVLTGYLKTRKQASELSSYVSSIFSYIDLLKKEVVVEEDIISQIYTWLQTANLPNIIPQMTNGDLTLTGNAPSDKLKNVDEIIA